MPPHRPVKGSFRMRVAVPQVPNLWNVGAESSGFLLGSPLRAGNVLFLKIGRIDRFPMDRWCLMIGSISVHQCADRVMTMTKFNLKIGNDFKKK